MPQPPAYRRHSLRGTAFSRRAAIRGGAALTLGVIGASLIGCGGSDDEGSSTGAAPTAAAASGAAATGTTTAASMEPVHGGTYVPASGPTFTYQHLDPTAAVWTAGFTAPTHSMLVRLDNSAPTQSDWKVENELVESWEQPDPTTYIFQLVPGVKFHNIAPVNGREMTSADVKFSLERIGTPKPQFFRQDELKDATITTPDDRTFQMSFPKPKGPFWNYITTPGTVVLPVEVQDTEGEVIKSGKPIAGTGPFIQEDFVENQTWKLTRNPDYFKQGLPYLDGIDAVSITNPDAQLVAFKAGKLPAITLLTYEQLQEAKSIPNIRFDQREQMRQSWIVFHTLKPPYGDIRVRKAISLAHPRSDIIDIAMRSEEIGTMLGPGGFKPDIHGSATYTSEQLKQRPGYRKGADRDADVAEAKKLLDAAGFTGLKAPLKYTQHLSAWPYNDTLITILTDALREIGFDFSLEPYSYGDTLVNMASEDFDIYHTPQDANGVDPDHLLGFYFSKDAVRNYGHWLNPKFDELMEKQDTTIDPEERNAVIFEIVQLLEEENPRTATYSQRGNAAYQAKLHNYWIEVPSAYPPLDRVWFEA